MAMGPLPSESSDETSNREKRSMKKLNNLVLQAKIWKDNRGQDLIEYALMAGFLAVAAAFLMPNLVTSITTLFTTIQTKLGEAGADLGGA